MAGANRSLRAPATLDALAALAARRPPRAGGGRHYRRRLSRAADRRASHPDDRRPAGASPAGRARPRWKPWRGSTGGTSGAELLALLAPACRSGRPAVRRAGLGARGAAVQRPRHPARASWRAMGFVEVEEAFRRIGDWRSGRARSLRSPAARPAFEAMLPTLMRAVAAGPDPIRALNRFGDIVDKLSSGVNLYRLLGARPQLADLLALILAHAPPLAEQLGRRPTLLDGLIDESSFAPPPDADDAGRALPRGVARRAVRHRARPHSADGRRTALRARRPAARRAPRPDRHRRGL